MTDYRSEAEKFVTAFLDYMDEYDILDKLNRQTQKMERSPGVQSLVTMAESVFPKRLNLKKGDKLPELTEKEVRDAIESSENVLDTQAMFGAKVQANGGTRDMLRALLEGEADAIERAKEFLAAENGEKEFRKDV